MEGGSTEGYFTIRIKSGVIYEMTYNGAVMQESIACLPACCVG